ncbi:MAG: hypothetical protein Q8M24_12985 [Pseudolabrys sp.]|nr:hypothetical protein [Pseudolabrys sp.]
MNSSTACRRAVDCTLIVLLTLASFYGVARAGLAPRDPTAGVGVIFAPWTSPTVALERAVAAGGSIVRAGGFPSVVIMMPDDPDYTSKVLRGGALMVVDPRVLEACLKALAR